MTIVPADADALCAPDVAEALDMGRDLARQGVPVFLAEPDGAGGFHHPDGWQHSKADPAVLDGWRPGMAVCAVMGVVCDAIDVDPRHDGEASASALRAAGAYPRSYGRAHTPSDGLHDLVARLHAGSRDNLRPGVDVKGGRDDGSGRGFVYIAPTVRASKVTGEPVAYVWEVPPDLDGITEDEDSDEVLRLADAVRQSRPGKAAAAPTEPVERDAQDDATRRRVDAYVAAVVERRCRDLRDMASWPVGQVDEHGRGWEKRAADAAHRLGALARATWNGLTEDEARQAFLAAAPTCHTWTARDVAEKWDQQSRRGEPAPWPASLDDDDTGVTFMAGQPTAEQPAPAAGDAPQECPPGCSWPHAQGVGGVSRRNAPLDWSEVLAGEQPPPDWLAEPVLEAGTSVVVYSPPKAGKSLLALDICAGLAAGRPVLSNVAREPVRVLYLDAENTQADLAERLRAMGYTPADLGDRLAYISFPSLPGLDTAAGGRALYALAHEHRAALVVIDTLSRFVEGDENEAQTYADLYRHALAGLKREGVAVLRLDHAGKDVAKGQRGSSAKSADVDAVWRLAAGLGSTVDLVRDVSRNGHGADRLRLSRLADPLLRHVPAGSLHGGGLLFVGDDLDPHVRNVVKALDDAEVPLDYGRDRARAMLAVPVRNDLLSQAIDARRRRADEAAPFGDGTP